MGILCFRHFPWYDSRFFDPPVIGIKRESVFQRVKKRSVENCVFAYKANELSACEQAPLARCRKPERAMHLPIHRSVHRFIISRRKGFVVFFAFSLRPVYHKSARLSSNCNGFRVVQQCLHIANGVFKSFIQQKSRGFAPRLLSTSSIRYHPNTQLSSPLLGCAAA